ncbi:hypothetical protein B0H15DRAFT_957179 [Mycena belliarum]|uniref:Uncharacterized protein n=1 Tax=Mycena belliarum TaxID=1033014 RepID=A0AAD6TQJ9_9AGAR|nr:hypothetical protein B0H15DRAFT_957179 [Mycena belliae]
MSGRGKGGKGLGKGLSASQSLHRLGGFHLLHLRSRVVDVKFRDVDSHALQTTSLSFCAASLAAPHPRVPPMVLVSAFPPPSHTSRRSSRVLESREWIGHRAPSSSSSPRLPVPRAAARPVCPPLEANPTPRPRPCHTPRTQSRPRIRATSSVCGLARERQLAAPPSEWPVAASRRSQVRWRAAIRPRRSATPTPTRIYARCARPPCAAGEGSGPAAAAAAARVAQRPGASLRLAGPDLRAVRHSNPYRARTRPALWSPELSARTPQKGAIPGTQSHVHARPMPRDALLPLRGAASRRTWQIRKPAMRRPNTCDSHAPLERVARGTPGAGADAGGSRAGCCVVYGVSGLSNAVNRGDERWSPAQVSDLRSGGSERECSTGARGGAARGSDCEGGPFARNALRVRKREPLGSPLESIRRRPPAKLPGSPVRKTAYIRRRAPLAPARNSPPPLVPSPEQKRWDAVSGYTTTQRRSDVPTAGPRPESRADVNAVFAPPSGSVDAAHIPSSGLLAPDLHGSSDSERASVRARTRLRFGACG